MKDIRKLTEELYNRLGVIQHIKRQYEPTPPPEGLIIGGRAIAALAMSAGKYASAYLMPELLPYAAERKRKVIAANPKDTSSLNVHPFEKSTVKTRDNYTKYGQFYKYLKNLPEKANRTYNEAIAAFKKLRARSYQRNDSPNISKIPYNTFKKSSLSASVLHFLRYLRTLSYSVTQKPDYDKGIRVTNKREDIGGLEILLRPT